MSDPSDSGKQVNEPAGTAGNGVRDGGGDRRQGRGRRESDTPRREVGEGHEDAKADALLRTIADSPLATLAVGDDRRVLALSDVAAALYDGRPREEIVGHRLEEFVPDDDREAAIAEFDEVLQRNTSAVVQSSVEGVDGQSASEFTSLITPNVHPGIHTALLFTSAKLGRVINDAEEAAEIVKVLVASPDPLALKFASDAAEALGNVGEVVRCDDFSRVTSMVQGHRPDVLILTTSPFSPPDRGHGGELVEVARRTIAFAQENSLDLGVLALIHEDDPEVSRDLLRLGVLGIFGPGDDREEFGEALAQVARGKVYLSASTAVQLTRHGGDEALGELTPREMAVLRLLALGYTNKEAADELFLSVRTVESHRANILSELGIEGRRQLVQVAIENDLIP